LPPTIQRTWGVVYKQWSTWSREDPEAQLLLEMLEDLGDALSRRIHTGANIEEAKKTFQKWNSRSSVKHTERSSMRTELREALSTMDTAVLDSILPPGTLAGGPWPSNVYLVGKSEELMPKSITLSDTARIRSFQGPSLHLKDIPLDEAAMKALSTLPKLKSLVLVKCRYPEDWNDATFGLLTDLRKLVFYGGNRAPLPGFLLDRLPDNPSLRILELIMADFLHHRDCYENLGRMRQLTILNLARTMTLEKTPVLSGARELMMKALTTLITQGDLIELNLAWCTVFTPVDLRILAEGLAKKGGHLILAEKEIERGLDE
jgi:hypothetical protein